MQRIIENLQFLNDNCLRSLRLSYNYMKDKDDPISLGHANLLRKQIKELEAIDRGLLNDN